MPIRIEAISVDKLETVKKAIEKISRDGFSLQNVSQSGSGVLSSMPSAANVDELQCVFVNDGGTRKLVIKLAGSLYYVSLTAV
jgi:hypothetical protein